jgi:hypothetical protein
MFDYFYNIFIPLAIYIHSEAFMFPNSFYHSIDAKIHEFNHNYDVIGKLFHTDFYDHMREVLGLEYEMQGETGWDWRRNPVNITELDNELPVLIYHAHGTPCI